MPAAQMPFKRCLQTAQDALRLKSGVWGTGGGGFLLTGLGFMLAGYAPLGWMVVGLGVGMLVWGTTIWGRNVWEPWWLGPIKPDVAAFLFDFPYQQGANIHGINWDQDFSHVNVRIANRSDETFTDLNFIVFLDRPIIKSVSISPLADCTIVPDNSGMPQITIVATDSKGQKIALTNADALALVDIRPRDRFICARLPHGVEIQLHIATVDPITPPPAKGKMWRKANPSWVRLGGTYVVRGIEQHIVWHFGLGKAPNDVAEPL